MPARVIYLPPGVTAAPPPHQQQPPQQNNIPFDRNFFQNILPEAIENFCKQTDCTTPIVEILTIDGTTHYVNGISGLSDTWVALHTANPDHEHPVQVFVPYSTVFRVGIHPAEEVHRQRLGFIVDGHRRSKQSLPKPRQQDEQHEQRELPAAQAEQEQQ